MVDSYTSTARVSTTISYRTAAGSDEDLDLGLDSPRSVSGLVGESQNAIDVKAVRFVSSSKDTNL
jgi:hypothetical protein